MKTTISIIAGNVASNYAEVLSSGQDLVSEWESKNFKVAGSDAAVILTDALGPIQSQMLQGHDKIMAVEKFLQGFIVELLKMEDFTTLDSCVSNSEKIFSEVELAVADFKKKDVQDIAKGIILVGQVVQEIPADIHTCESVANALPELKKWAEMFKHPTDLLKVVLPNLLKNYKTIVGDVKDISSSWSAKDFETVGKDIANMLVLSVGQVSEVQFSEYQGASDYIKLVEGLLYGLVKDENLKNIDTCITDMENLEALLKVAISDFEDGSFTSYIAAVKEIGLVIQAVP